MSVDKNSQATQQPPFGAPPAYSSPMAPYPLKDETPQYATASVPVPAAIVGNQYREQLFAACARGQHERTTRFGPCGIITAIFFFPIGLICLFADTEHRCARCGVSLN